MGGTILLGSLIIATLLGVLICNILILIFLIKLVTFDKNKRRGEKYRRGIKSGSRAVKSTTDHESNLAIMNHSHDS